MAFCKIMLIGNLGRDPEMRYLPSGSAVCNFSVAVTDRWTKDGERQERTTWYRVAAFGKLAEVCNEYLAKGRKVLVEGRLNSDPETGGPRVYQKNDGSYGASFEVTAASVEFLSARGDGPNGAGEGEGEGDSSPASTSTETDFPF